MSVVDHASRNVALAGQSSSGDRSIVAPFDGGALVALVDGLGHGTEACIAAEAAVEVLATAPAAAVDDLIERCHERLRTTRGAVISVASFDAAHATMTWVGVGNVEGMLVRGPAEAVADAAIVMRGGTVGFMLPPLTPRALAVRPGDTLVFASDGIRPGFKVEVLPVRTPQQIADAIIERYAKSSDDACVVVARYVGQTRTTRVEIEGELDVPHARKATRDAARKLGFAAHEIEALATAVSELARNIIAHAERGEIEVAPAHAPRTGLVVVARDRGPGIADVALALTDGYTTAGGLGLGLPAAKRLVDEMELRSELGLGTTVTLRKWLR